MDKRAVLFVCLANICRSPAAEGVLRHLAAQKKLDDELLIDSCGIGDWQIGSSPDARMQKAAQIRGITLTGRARQFNFEDLDLFEFILAADKEVLHTLYHYAKAPHHKAKIKLITDFSPSYASQDIPDPYYGGEGSFELVLDMLEESCEGLLASLFPEKQNL